MADLNSMMQWQSIPIGEMGGLLQQQGFSFNKHSSYDQHRVFTSNDGKVNVVLNKQDGAIYTNGNNKVPVHRFSVVANDFKGSANDKAVRTGQR